MNAEKLLQAVNDRVQSLRASIQLEADEMTKLEAAGLKYAGEWWKDGKYLYLTYPSDGTGQRKREYIGNDEQAIADARAAIQRGQKYDKAKARKEELELTIKAIESLLTTATTTKGRLW